jgi:hypothetical protein
LSTGRRRTEGSPTLHSSHSRAAEPGRHPGRVTGELREGGTYQLEGNAGGTVESCVAPNSFALTWEFGGMVSWLSVTFTEADGGTILELVHEAPVDPEFWAQYGPGAVGLGWDGALLGLGMHVEIDPAYAASFNFSADGDDSEAAARAAEGAYAAYTTAPEGP